MMVEDIELIEVLQCAADLLLTGRCTNVAIVEAACAVCEVVSAGTIWSMRDDVLNETIAAAIRADLNFNDIENPHTFGMLLLDAVSHIETTRETLR